MLNEGLVIHDCDIKVNREQPLSITASKLKHLVHLLNTGNFSHEARCTIVDLVPDSLSTDLLKKMDEQNDQTMLESTSDSCDGQETNTDIES